MTDNVVDLGAVRPPSSLEFDTLDELAEGMEAVGRVFREGADAGEVVGNFDHLKMVLTIDFGQRRFVLRTEAAP